MVCPAIFTSDRIESIGGKDVFIAYFKDQIIDQLSVHRYAYILSTSDSLASESVIEDSFPSPILLGIFVSKPLYYWRE